MKIRIIAIGKPKEPAINELVAEYQKRLTRFSNVELIYVNENKNTEQKIISLTENSFKVLLDEKGKAYTTTSFSDYLEKRFLDGRDISFLIGGPNGHTESIRNISDHTIRLSQLTLTHELALLFFHETLYRSLAVLNKHPYHRA